MTLAKPNAEFGAGPGLDRWSIISDWLFISRHFALAKALRCTKEKLLLKERALIDSKSFPAAEVNSTRDGIGVFHGNLDFGLGCPRRPYTGALHSGPVTNHSAGKRRFKSVVPPV